MADRYLDCDDAVADFEDLPRYEKRRRPMRGTFNTPVRRAALQSQRRSGASSSSSSGSRPSGFHRRIIKKPFFHISKTPAAAPAL